MQIKIIINCENEAFSDLPGMEVSRILRELCDEMLYGVPKDKILRDVNGNTVGAFIVEE